MLGPEIVQAKHRLSPRTRSGVQPEADLIEMPYGSRSGLSSGWPSQTRGPGMTTSILKATLAKNLYSATGEMLITTSPVPSGVTVTF